MVYCAALCAHGLPQRILQRLVSLLRCNGGLWVRCVRRTTLRDAAPRRNVACAAAFDIPYRRAAGRGGVFATDAADADDSAQDEGPPQQGTPKWESPKWEGLSGKGLSGKDLRSKARSPAPLRNVRMLQRLAAWHPRCQR